MIVISHFTNVTTQIRDRDALVAALAELGYPVVECHSIPQLLADYHGSTAQGQVANVIIRRKQIGALSNDIGFVIGPDGNYRAIISEYDSGKHDAAWLKKLKISYAVGMIKKAQVAKGFKILSQQRRGDGTTRILVDMGV